MEDPSRDRSVVGNGVLYVYAHLFEMSRYGRVLLDRQAQYRGRNQPSFHGSRYS